MKLSTTERCILANQYRILERLYGDEAEDFSIRRVIVEEGFESEYHLVFQALSEPVEDALCKEVIAILDMHAAIQRCWTELEAKDEIDEGKILFYGFDGNNETSQMAFAEFLFEREGRFKHLRIGADGFNSHWPMMDRYRGMLRHWQALESRYKLSKEDIRAILAAGDTSVDEAEAT